MATKYRSEWTDILGLDWCIEIGKASYTGAITDLQSSDDPLLIEMLSVDDDFFQNPIKGSKADISVYCDVNFELKQLYSVQDLEWSVTIENSNGLYWSGFLLADNFSEPYDGVSYKVTLSASDGLGILKNFLFVDGDGEYYNGRISQSNILLSIFDKIGIASFNEFINIYEEDQADEEGSSPLDQTYIDVDVFKDFTCYQVLETILKSYNAIIRQSDGILVIFRPTELINSIVYGRSFTSSSKSSISINPDQYIKRSIIDSDLIDQEGGYLTKKSSAKKAICYQNYGSKESWLDNHTFDLNQFSGTSPYDYAAASWNKSSYVQIAPCSYYLKDEKDGVIIITHNTYPALPYYIYQTFGIYAVATSNMFKIDFEYQFINKGTTTRTEAFYVRVLAADGGHWLYSINETECVWSTALNTIILTHDAPVVSEGWHRFERQFVGLPITGLYNVAIYGLNSAYNDVYIAVRNFRIYSTSVEVTRDTKAALRAYIKEGKTPFTIWTTKEYPVPVTYKGVDIVEKTYEGLRGLTYATEGKILEVNQLIGDVTDSGMDNILEQFNGALSAREIQAAHVFNKILIRNEEMNNLLSIASSTLLTITDKTGQVLTVATLPDYDKFDLTGWVAMLIDEDATNTTDPTPTGDYLYKEFCTIDRAAKTLTFDPSVSLSSFGVGDNLCLYNAFLNYNFVGDQSSAPIISLVGSPTWRSMMTGAGPMFRHSDGRFIMLFIGFQASPTRGNIGYVSSSDMVNWTIGNSDNYVYAATNFPDCTTVNLTGNCYPVDGSPGDYWCLVFYGRTSDGHGVHRIFYFDEDFTTFSYSDTLMTDTDLGFAGGSILKIGDYYHLIYMLITAAGVPYRSINAAKSSDLEGPYTNYQTNIVRGIDSNDGTAWSYSTDAPCIFDDGIRIFGLFGSQAQYSESGTKGNRQYSLLDFDAENEVWSASENGPILVNPLYYQDLDGSYTWAGDHCGGYPSIFIEGADIYMSLTMKGSYYQVALIKMNNLGLEYPTAKWNSRGKLEDKPLLEIITDELALQFSRSKEMISLPILEGKTTNDVHVNLIGNIQDTLNFDNLLYDLVQHSCTYSTFETLRTSVVDADNMSGSVAAISNPIQVEDGDVLRLIFPFVSQGQNPLVDIVDYSGGGSITDEGSTQTWLNVFEYTFTINSTTIGALKIFNSVEAHFTTDDIFLILNYRKFAINRGTFDVKNRQWNLDLIEIIK